MQEDRKHIGLQIGVTVFVTVVLSKLLLANLDVQQPWRSLVPTALAMVAALVVIVAAGRRAKRQRRMPEKRR